MVRNYVAARFVPTLAALGALFMLLASFEARAATTGGISGKVTAKEDDEPLEGVMLALSAEGGVLGGNLSVTSSADGNFVFTQLLPGSYTVTATKADWGTVKLEHIQVNVGSQSPVSIAMIHNTNSGDKPMEIVVQDKKKAVDVNQTSRREVLSKEFLESIPTGRSFQTAVQSVAGVVAGSGGNPNMGGGASNENTYMLDGVNITDPVTGTFSLNFNYDAIQQIEVLLGGYEPEYGISLGGVVNVVTESGNNNLSFSASAYLTTAALAAKTDARYSADGFRIAPTDFDSTFTIYEIDSKISGPVIRDKAWFIFSYAAQRSLIANSGIPLPRDYDANYILGKLTVQPVGEHRFTFLLQTDPTTIDNTNQSSLTVRPEAQGRQAQGGVVTMAEWQWFLSPKANLDTKFILQKSNIEVNGVPCTHDTKLGYNPCKPDEVEGANDWETPGRNGMFGAFDSVNYGYFYFDHRDRYQASAKLAVVGAEVPRKDKDGNKTLLGTLFGGTHDMKFGAEAVQTVWDQTQGYSGNTLYYDINRIGYDPSTFTNYYWLEITGPIKFRTTGSQWNVFAQDAWKPISNVTIKYGLRYDNTVMRNDLGDPVIAASLFGPRLYASWDPFGDQKTKVAGGYGRFNDTSNLGVASFTSASNYGSKLYLGENFNDNQGTGFVNDANHLYDIGPRTNPNTSLKTLRAPRVDELLLMLQRELVTDVSLGTTLSYKMTRFLFEHDETNVIYDQDGSAIIGARNGDPLTNIYRLRTPVIAKRNYFQGDFYLDKIFSKRWFGRVTYSYVQSLGNSQYSQSGTFTNDPQTKYTYGNMLSTDVQHQVKAYGAWKLPTEPWAQTVGGSLMYTSGYLFERYYWSDESQGYGIRIRDRQPWARLPGWWDLALSFSQDIDVKKGQLRLSVQATNLLNLRKPVFVDTYYVAAENRAFVTNRQDPLQVQFGAQYKF